MKNENDLINNISYYYALSQEVQKEFAGPSIYFHIQTIKEQERNFLSDRHIEMIFATLASWGMHRMGDPENTKAKMVEFNDFKQSIVGQQKKLESFVPLRIESTNIKKYEECLDELKEIYFVLRVSISEATIVSHSKTLAHILPNLVPPIDRQHTIRFFTQDKTNFFTKSGKYRMINLPSGNDAQFAVFKEICCRIKSLFDSSDHKIFRIDKTTFNTSYPKIMDNLIMAFVKDVSKP